MAHANKTSGRRIVSVKKVSFANVGYFKKFLSTRFLVNLYNVALPTLVSRFLVGAYTKHLYKYCTT
jgi:hypothetical protein